MAIKKMLAVCLLAGGISTIYGQKPPATKKEIKKPVAAKTVAPTAQTIRFNLSENCDYGNVVLYRGQVKDGKANGYGKAFIYFSEIADTTNPHLGIYEGFWKDNAFSGKGELYPNINGVSQSKTVYRGDFENGKYHGQGKLWPMYNTYKEGTFNKGVYVEGSAPVAEVKKEEAKTSPAPAPPAVSLKPTRPPEEMFYAGEADYANVDWDALGRRPPEPGYTRPSAIAFLEEVSKDVRKYLNETFTKNGATYKRYRRSREVSNGGNNTAYSGQDVTLSGRSTPVVIITYCQNFGADARAKVTVDYAGYGKKTEKTILTGATCNVVTKCSAKICKTTCNGNIELDFGSSKTLWLMKEGNWNGLERVYWVILADLNQ